MDKVKNIIHKVTSKRKPADSQTILITGASGFVAAHVLNEFLEHGYKVRGTVRSEETANKVRATHAKYADNLSFAIVKDVAAPGAFDEAVKGVDGVIHTASPFQTSGIEDNERDLLNPAIHGTTEILNAIAKYNPSISRIVITSSFAAMVNMSEGFWPSHTYSEADWNPVTYDDAKSTSAGSVAYCASKTFAERAAWDFAEKNKPNWDIATILPPMVYGPNAHAVSSVDHLNTSSADIYGLINGSKSEVPTNAFWAYVDVRDVALAHRLAYEVPEAGGNRFFITAGNYHYQEFCDIIRKDVPEARDRTPEGKPGSGLGGVQVYKVDNGKSKKVLGIQYRSMEETVADAAKSLVEIEARK